MPKKGISFTEKIINSNVESLISWQAESPYSNTRWEVQTEQEKEATPPPFSAGKNGVGRKPEAPSPPWQQCLRYIPLTYILLWVQSYTHDLTCIGCIVHFRPDPQRDLNPLSLVWVQYSNTTNIHWHSSQVLRLVQVWFSFMSWKYSFPGFLPQSLTSPVTLCLFPDSTLLFHPCPDSWPYFHFEWTQVW